MTRVGPPARTDRTQLTLDLSPCPLLSLFMTHILQLSGYSFRAVMGPVDGSPDCLSGTASQVGV